MTKLRLRRDRLAVLRKVKGEGVEVDAVFAKRINIHPGQLSRILSGQSAPGTKFIAGVLELFGGVDMFGELFALDPDDDNGAAA